MISNISEFDTSVIDNELVKLPTTEPPFPSVLIEYSMGQIIKSFWSQIAMEKFREKINIVTAHFSARYFTRIN
jgi:hypothetical protein